MRFSVLFLQLLGEYDSVMKQHEGVKVTVIFLELMYVQNLVLSSDFQIWIEAFSLITFVYPQNKMVSAENKLVDANDQISELKR